MQSELKFQPQVRTETFARYTREAADLRPEIGAATATQPEFTVPVWDYIARLVDDERIEEGRGALAQHADALNAIARKRGVDAHTVVAFYGIETDYGKGLGRFNVVDATLSRACLDLKSKERQRHFFAALWLLQEGLVQAETFKGSWAGAFGLTQFMPATFVAFMDDGDGSGTVDIIGSPADALATTANYVASLGWTAGFAWGIEVSLRDAPNAAALIAAQREHACLSSPTGGGKCRMLRDWLALGVRPVELPEAGGGVLNEAGVFSQAGWLTETLSALLAPAGPDGPAWLVSRNYRAIWQYNRADSYAIAIGLLANALRGDAPLRAGWPTADPGLSRAEMRAVQQALVERGHHEVKVDGADGPKTRAAIRAEERKLSLPETGRAGRALAALLREGGPKQMPEAPVVVAPSSIE